MTWVWVNEDKMFCVDYTELGQHMEDSQSKVKQKQKVLKSSQHKELKFRRETTMMLLNFIGRNHNIITQHVYNMLFVTEINLLSKS